MEFNTAFLVISLKTILSYSSSFKLSISFKCQAIASPSLSLSVAIYTFEDFFFKVCNSLITFFLSGDGIYVGINPFSLSIDLSSLAKSLM